MGYKIANFIIFVGILIYYLRAPIRKFWRERHKNIHDTINFAQHLHETAVNEEKTWNNKLKGMDGEITDLIKELKKEGEFERKNIVDQATTYANRLVEDAGKVAGFETLRVAAELKRFAITKAVEVASNRLLKETMLDEHIQIAEAAVKEVETAL